jgi:energy-coupling factor transporter transmembrane protein EcfT
MIQTALRFLPQFIDEFRSVRKIQKLNGYKFRIIKPIFSLKTEFKIILSVFFHALRKAQETTDALLARGYFYQKNISIKNKININFLSKILLLFMIISLVLLVILKIFYFLYISNIFYSENLKTIYFFTHNYL